MRLPKNRRSKETALVGIYIYGRGRLTLTAKARVSKKRSLVLTGVFAGILLQKNALLRPADFFDSLNIRTSLSVI